MSICEFTQLCKQLLLSQLEINHVTHKPTAQNLNKWSGPKPAQEVLTFQLVIVSARLSNLMSVDLACKHETQGRRIVLYSNDHKEIIRNSNLLYFLFLCLLSIFVPRFYLNCDFNQNVKPFYTVTGFL